MSAQPKTPIPQWWKAWVLLTGLGVTVIGSLALRPSPPTEIAAIDKGASGQLAPVSRDVARPRLREFGGLSGNATARQASALPMKPARPIFAAPVTRTRRS